MIRSKTWKLLILVVLIITVALIYLFCGNTREFEDRIPAVEKTQYMEPGDDWRDHRYGEIIAVYRKGFKLYMEVYNTVNSNELPEDLWEKIDSDALAKEYGAMAVLKNGPRHWVVNNIEAGPMSKDRKIANFGGIEMTQRAKLHKTIFQGSLGSKKYAENVVNRETTYYYYKGNMVYELTSPAGDVYRMQSYSQQVDPSLTIDDLEMLGDKLDLPAGWTYRARILDEDSKLTADGKAYIINDELLNTYQKMR